MANPVRHDPMLMSVVDLASAAHSGRFAKGALRRLNEAIKSREAALSERHDPATQSAVNVGLLDSVDTAFFSTVKTQEGNSLKFMGVQDCCNQTFVHIKSRLSHCDGCRIELISVSGVTGIAPKTLCSRCRVACYCSKACQKKDWKSHKEICSIMSLLPEEPTFRQPVLQGKMPRSFVRDVSGAIDAA